MIRVAVVDDHPHVAIALRTLLDETPDIQMVAEARSGGDVAALVRAAAPQNASLRGCRGTDDPSYLGLDLLEHRPERPAMKDLWGTFAALAEASSG